MGELSVVRGNIVDDELLAKADAIVLPTNPMMRCGAGVSGAIFRKAGVEQLERYTKETYGVSYEDLTRKNEMRPGDVRIAPGFALPCDIIFAQGPKAYVYANYDEALSLLLLTYKNTLKVAAKQGYRTILMPALGTGSYRFLHAETAEPVMRLLLEELRLYDLSVIFVVWEESVAPLYTRWLEANPGQSFPDCSALTSQDKCFEEQINTPNTAKKDGENMGKINSKAKGKRFELMLASTFCKHGYDARRSAQYCGNTGDASDVVGLPGIHIEAKHQETMRLYEWMAQARKDSEGTGMLPTVFHKKNNAEILVTMRLEDWFELYREWEAGQPAETKGV